MADQHLNMCIVEVLVELLLRERKVCFSFFTDEAREARSGVYVMLCEEHDMLEYNVEFERDAYFEVGPVDAPTHGVSTGLVFASCSEAGDWLIQAFEERSTRGSPQDGTQA